MASENGGSVANSEATYSVKDTAELGGFWKVGDGEGEWLRGEPRGICTCGECGGEDDGEGPGLRKA